MQKDAIEKRIARSREATKLTELDLSDLNLETIPSAVLQITTLRTLNLRNNCLRALGPDFVENMGHLEILNVAKNVLDHLPPDLGLLTSLRKLYLQGNQLASLPEGINGLHQLEELYVQQNNLRELPESIAQLRQLSTLSVAHNHLERLPININELSQLKIVDLSGNPLTFVPERIRRLHDKHLLLHSRERRRQLIFRALRVRKVVEERRILALRSNNNNNNSSSN